MLEDISDYWITRMVDAAMNMQANTMNVTRWLTYSAIAGKLDDRDRAYGMILAALDGIELHLEKLRGLLTGGDPNENDRQDPH